MPDYKWPDAEHRTLIGKRTLRVDSPDKVSGQARYTYDVKRPGLLFGKMLRAPYAHCKVVSIDISAAEKMPGVKSIQIVQKAGSTQTLILHSRIEIRPTASLCVSQLV